MSCTAMESDPFNQTLWGEYARMLIVGTAVFSGAAWAIRFTIEPRVIAMVIANVFIVGITAVSRFAGLSRLTLLSLLVIGIVAACAASQIWNTWWSPITVFSPIFTVVKLLILMVRDAMIMFRNRVKAISPGRIMVAVTFLVVSVYMVLLPSLDAHLLMFRDLPESYQIEESSPLEVLRIRSAKLFIFAILAYAAACVGSFLNVVGASVPRGESIALRSLPARNAERRFNVSTTC